LKLKKITKDPRNQEIKDPRLIQELPVGKDPIEGSEVILKNKTAPLFRLSIRLSPSFVSSISLKVHFLALWCLLGSHRDILFPKGRVYPIYSELQAAIGDFIYLSILNKFKGKSAKGLSDFVFSCFCKDILKCTVLNSSNNPKRKLITRVQDVPFFSPQDYNKVLKCLIKGEERNG
jgi:hypothetical protein